MKQKIGIIASVIFLTFGLASNAMSQWFDCFCTMGSKIFAGANSSLLVSNDSGSTWSKLGPIFICPKCADTGLYQINALAVCGSNLFAGTDSGVFRSIDSGMSWMKTNAPSFKVEALFVVDTTLFAGIGDIYWSTNMGESWNNFSIAQGNGRVICFAAQDSKLYAGSSYGGVFRSTNDGKKWVKANSGLTDHSSIKAFAQIGRKLFAASDGVFISTNEGDSWVEADSVGEYFSSLAVTRTNLFGGSGGAFGGVFISTNYARNWSVIPPLIPRIHALAVFGDYLFVGTSQVGVQRILLSDLGLDAKVMEPTQRNFSLSPNPTTGIITVHNTPANILHVTVSSILGESVLALQHPNAPDFTLDLSKLPAGIYFARFALQNEVITRKIMKE